MTHTAEIAALLMMGLAIYAAAVTLVGLTLRKNKAKYPAVTPEEGEDSHES